MLATNYFALSAGDLEYTNCISAEKQTSVLGITLNNLMVKLL